MQLQTAHSASDNYCRCFVFNKRGGISLLRICRSCDKNEGRTFRKRTAVSKFLAYGKICGEGATVHTSQIGAKGHQDSQGIPDIPGAPDDEGDAQDRAEHHTGVEQEELQVQPKAVAEFIHEWHDHHDGDQRIRVVARQHLPCARVTGEKR